MIGFRNQAGVCILELSQIFFSGGDLTVIRLPLPREFKLKYMVRRSDLFQDLTVKRHTIKPGTQNDGTRNTRGTTEQRNAEHQWNSRKPRNNGGIPE